jgi:hypothetical protein
VEALVVQDQDWSLDRLSEAIVQERESGLSTSQIAKELAANSGWTKSKVYDLIMDIQKNKAASK